MKSKLWRLFDYHKVSLDKRAERKAKAAEVDLKMCWFLLSDLEDDQADLVNGDTADQTTDGEEVVRKPRKKK